MTWKSATDRVLVTAPIQKTETETGIVLPDRMKASLYEGTVIAAGPDATGVKPEDTVFYQASKFLVNVADGVVSITADAIVAIQRAE